MPEGLSQSTERRRHQRRSLGNSQACLGQAARHGHKGGQARKPRPGRVRGVRHDVGGGGHGVLSASDGFRDGLAAGRGGRLATCRDGLAGRSPAGALPRVDRLAGRLPRGFGGPPSVRESRDCLVQGGHPLAQLNRCHAEGVSVAGGTAAQASIGQLPMSGVGQGLHAVARVGRSE